MSIYEEIFSRNWTPWLMLGAFVIGAGGGATVNQWRLDAKIERIQLDQSKKEVIQATEALTQLNEAASAINLMARNNKSDVASIKSSIEQLRKDYNNEKVKPLPVDCLPDPARVRKLDKTIDAVNGSITGSKPSGTVPNDTKAGKS